MTHDAPRHDDYEQARQRLLGVMTRCAEAQLRRAWSPTPVRAELSSLARELRQLADRVEAGPAWSELEDYADQATGRRHTKGAVRTMAELADLAEEAAAALPDARARPWLAECALLYLHVRYRCGLGAPSLYDEGPDVVEFGRLLTEAGAPKSMQRVRGLLAAALRGFDPQLPPPGLSELV